MRKMFNNFWSAVVWCADALQVAYLYVFGDIKDPASDNKLGKRFAVIGGVYYFVAVIAPTRLLHQLGADFDTAFMLMNVCLLGQLLLRMWLPGLERRTDWSTDTAVVIYRINPFRLLYRQFSFVLSGCIVALALTVMLTDYRPPVGQSPIDVLLVHMPSVSALLVPIIALLAVWRLLQWAMKSLRSMPNSYVPNV